jgi:pSer/pThr/pTyr-binding forkhead associated (FHA) protein
MVVSYGACYLPINISGINNMAAIIQTVDGVVANKFEIEESVLKFGRTADNQVQIDNLEVSNEHAQVVREINDEGKIAYFLEDLGSTNGSFINEEKIDKQQLYHKDCIRIGLNVFTFIDEGKVDIEKTSEIKKSWIPGVYYTK